MKFEWLFKAGKIGSLELKNRIVMAPMFTHLAEKEGGVTDAHIDYYVERARGGAGLIATEAAYIIPRPARILVHDDKFIPGLQRLAGAVHKAGAKFAVQILSGSGMRDKIDPVSPSGVPHPKIGVRPRTLSVDEIKELVAKSGDAALEIIRKHSIAPEQIEEVRAGVSGYAYVINSEPIEVKRKPRSVVDGRFSLPYTVACALVRNKVDLDDFTEEEIRDPVVLGIASRVNPYVDAEIDREAGRRVPPTLLEVRTKTGEVYSVKVNIAKGHPANPMTDEEFEAKFRACAFSGIKGVSPKAVNDLIDTLKNLEQVDDIRKVTRLFHLTRAE